MPKFKPKPSNHYAEPESALAQLVDRIRRARELGFLDQEWLVLAETALGEAPRDWMDERTFRDRTGAGEEWCRKHFAAHEAEGLARRRGRKRWWHRHARLPRRGATDEDLKREIVGIMTGHNYR